MNWVIRAGLGFGCGEAEPCFVHNTSGRFESRWTTVCVIDSPALMLRSMSGLVFGIHVAHSEGLLHFPDAPEQKDLLIRLVVNLITDQYSS